MSAEHSVMAAAQTSDAPGRAKPISCRYLRFGPFQVDVVRQQLSRNGIRLKLYGKAYQVLLLLLEGPGEIVTREQIRQRLWHSESDLNVDANINTTVNRIRLILKDKPESPAYIETVTRKGYCFIGHVEGTNVPMTDAGAAPREEISTPEEVQSRNHPVTLFSGMPGIRAGLAGMVFLAIVLGFLAGLYWSSVVHAGNIVLSFVIVLAVALASYRAGQSIVSRASRELHSGRKAAQVGGR